MPALFFMVDMAGFIKRGSAFRSSGISKAAASSILTKVIQIAEPILERMGLELVYAKAPVEGGRLVLRFFIDKIFQADNDHASSITLDDCALFSRQLDDELESIDWGQAELSEYLLEVSSPGLDRPLLKLSDYVRFSGRLVKMKIKKDGRNQTLKGRLGQAGEDIFFVEDAAGKLEFSFEDVVTCRLSLDDLFENKGQK